jgi:hypothetical protein
MVMISSMIGSLGHRLVPLNGFGYAIEPSSATHRLRRYSLRSWTTGSKIKVT